MKRLACTYNPRLRFIEGEGQGTPPPVPTPAPPAYNAIVPAVPVPTPPAVPAATPTPTATSAPSPAPAEGERGFPEKTPIEQMTPEQQAAYWKFHARKHESTAAARADYDQLKAELDQFKQQAMTEQEKAVAQARQEGAAEALRVASRNAATSIMESMLLTRGREQGDVDLIVSTTNFDPFVADGKVDTVRLTEYVNRIAPAQTQTPQNWPKMGQGERQQGQKVSGLDAGRELFQRRRGTRAS